jgi:hypothetical protein
MRELKFSENRLNRILNLNKNDKISSIASQVNNKLNLINKQLNGITLTINNHTSNRLEDFSDLYPIEFIVQANGWDQILPILDKFTDFMRKDLEFIKTNE